MSETLQRPILKEGRKYKVRVLRPSEYAILRGSSDHPEALDAGLYTGMRYIELQRLRENPAWFDGTNFVYLPASAMKKDMGVRITKEGKKVRRPRTQLNRWVKVNSHGAKAVAVYLESRRLPTWETWTVWIRDWAEKAGLDPEGLGPKTTRKTWESWLTFYYGTERLLEIVQSQGHTTGTSLHHYLSMPFLPKDREDMGPYVTGMFEPRKVGV